MAAYLIANIEVHDPEGFARYGALVAPMVARFGGRYLVRGGNLETLEGQPGINRLVILEYPDMATLRAFYFSEEYKPLLAMREAATTSHVTLAEGYAP
jgi:uncharacterized protein (DUF1330 family)